MTDFFTGTVKMFFRSGRTADRPAAPDSRQEAYWDYEAEVLYAASETLTWIALSSGILLASVVAGTGISVDVTDPANPIINATGVQSVSSGTGISVDNTDPVNPIINNSGGSNRDLFVQTASAATITNTLVETTLFGAGVGSLTTLAGFWRTGRGIEIHMSGYLNTASPAGTFTVRIKLGTDAIVVTIPGAALPDGVSGNPYVLMARLVCSTTDADVTHYFRGAGLLQIAVSESAVLSDSFLSSDTVIDITGDLAIDVTIQCDTADPANQIVPLEAFVRAFDAGA